MGRNETTGERWELKELYAGVDDPALEADLQRAQAAAQDFGACYRDRLRDAPMAALLRDALADQIEVQRPLLQAYGFAQLLFSADSGRTAHRQLLARVRECWSAVNEALLFFELEINAIDEEHFIRLVAADELTAYRHYLNQLRAHRPYQLEEKVEQALKRKDLSGKDAFVQLFDEVTAGLRFRFQFPGEEQEREADGEELLALLYHHDAELRERAFATYLDTHRQQEPVLTACFNNLLLDHGKEAELRNYPDLMTPTHLSSETEPAMVAEMMAVTEDNYSLAREYFSLKADLLGLDRLKNTDIYAPVAATQRSFTFAEAKELVVTAYREFSPKLAGVAERFFDQGHIDAFPRPGKSGGAFCMGVLPELEPFVLLNHTGTLRDVSTMAHELGHGIHFSCSGRQNIYHYHAPLPLAETASVFGEMLLTRYLLDTENDPGLKIALLCAKLEDIIATTFRQNALTRFELAAHRLRGERLLSADDLCTLWWEENLKLFGTAVTMIEPYRWGWSYISHFIHARFYCYSYVFGELLTLALYRHYREHPAEFVPRYEELLGAGGSRSPQQLLEPFGIDLGDGGFWQQGYDVVRELLDELQSALAEFQGQRE